MSDRHLRRKLIRLAHERPELRDDLLPLLKGAPRTAAVHLDKRLVKNAQRDVEQELEVLQSIKQHYRLWELAHERASKALKALGNSIEDHDEVFDELGSDFANAAWYGLDVRDFHMAMGNAMEELDKSYGVMQRGARLLKALDEIE